MPRPEKIITRIAGPLFILAAVLEGVSRLGDLPEFHNAAIWFLLAAMFTVLAPIAVAAAIIAYQALVVPKKNRDSDSP